MKFKTLLALLFAFALIAAACGDDDDDANGGTAAGCDPLPTFADGVLTVATGETVFPPWMGAGENDFDDPTTGTGYEGALVYALAEELGFGDDQVTWVRTSFDDVIAAGELNACFYNTQPSPRDARDAGMASSDGYYQVEQAIIGSADSPAASATSIGDLKSLRIGAAIGTTSLDYVDNVIDPDGGSQVYDDNVAAKSAFDAGQVDGIVFDLPTAYFVTAVEIEGSSVIGVLPIEGDAEELGMLFKEGNPLVPCVNDALATLSSNGTLDALADEWLNAGGGIPTLTK